MKCLHILSMFCLLVMISACDQTITEKNPESEKMDTMAASALKSSRPLKEGEYKMTPQCLDASKNIDVTQMQRTILIKKDNTFLYREISVAATCTEKCQATMMGTYLLTELQFTLKILKVLNPATGKFIDVEQTDHSLGAVTVLKHDRETNVLTLLDENGDTNPCKGRMTWTLSL
jgi:hypothetical protein